MNIGQKIRVEAKKQNLNFKQFALKAGMPYTSFYSILKRDTQRVSAVSLYKIAKALGISMEYFLDDEAMTAVYKAQPKPEKKKKKVKKKKKSKKIQH